MIFGVRDGTYENVQKAINAWGERLTGKARRRILEMAGREGKEVVLSEGDWRLDFHFTSPLD